ncbi:MAG: dehydratase [SAR116 cluster bacterium]|nr:dehydratase [SAR116 cluster bacterium]RPH08208.1 MAG: dehydratase [Alphaproteobacteria bacterium TMED54]
MIKNRYFEDFNVGEKFVLPSRTQTSGLFSMFQAVSGDNDPIHYDKEFCRKKGHSDMLAHGIQILSQTAAGAGTFPSQVRESLIGMIEITGKFLKPVYKNDTIYPSLEIIKLIPQKTTGIIEMKVEIINQNEKLVFEGSHKYLIKKN